MSYYSDPYTHSGNKIKVALGLSNYATKSKIKNSTSANT